MSKGHGRSANDQRSDSKNPNNPARQASNDNRSNQFNPTSSTHQAVLDNRSHQIQENKIQEKIHQEVSFPREDRDEEKAKPEARITVFDYCPECGEALPVLGDEDWDDDCCPNCSWYAYNASRTLKGYCQGCIAKCPYSRGTTVTLPCEFRTDAK